MLAVALAFFSSDYVLYVFLTWVPTYLKENQGYSIVLMTQVATGIYVAQALGTLAAGMLSDALAARGHLAGTGFTVGDLNVASILVWGKMARLDFTAYPDLKRWLDACLARPAYGRLRERSSRQ